MSFYKCGHEKGLIVLDAAPVAFNKYLRWRETVGLDGKRTKCWNCFRESEKKAGE